MIYRPSIAPFMWDTWLYHHEGKHHLFYIQKPGPDAASDSIGVAISEDGVHFEELEPIIHRAKDATKLGSGMVWRAGKHFMLNFCEARQGVQEIFFAESNDLLHWRRLPDEEYVCRADTRWYADSLQFAKQRWDCIWVLPRDDAPGFIGFLTAVSRNGPPGLRGTIGSVLSDDGRHFHAGPPAVEPGVWSDRVPPLGAVEKIGDRYYALLGVHPEMPLGARHAPWLLAGEGGMYVLVSDQQTGPYRLLADNPPLLGSRPIHYAYFGRFYRFENELLFNHHSVTRRLGFDGSFAPLKSVHSDDAGLLSLRWWPGNEVLKGPQRPSPFADSILYGLRPDQVSISQGRLQLSAEAGGFAILPIEYDTARGVILEAEVVTLASDAPLYGSGIFVEEEPVNRSLPWEGTCGTLLLSQSNGRLTVGPHNHYGFTPVDDKCLPFFPAESSRWRLLLRDVHVELYVDDELVQCYTLMDKATGRLGFAVEACTVTVKNVRVWEMSL
jgi:hypothetical protein